MQTHFQPPPRTSLTCFSILSGETASSQAAAATSRWTSENWCWERKQSIAGGEGGRSWSFRGSPVCRQRRLGRVPLGAERKETSRTGSCCQPTEPLWGAASPPAAPCRPPTSQFTQHQHGVQEYYACLRISFQSEQQRCLVWELWSVFIFTLLRK